MKKLKITPTQRQAKRCSKRMQNVENRDRKDEKEKVAAIEATPATNVLSLPTRSN